MKISFCSKEKIKRPAVWPTYIYGQGITISKAILPTLALASKHTYPHKRAFLHFHFILTCIYTYGQEMILKSILPSYSIHETFEFQSALLCWRRSRRREEPNQDQWQNQDHERNGELNKKQKRIMTSNILSRKTSNLRNEDSVQKSNISLPAVNHSLW